VPDHWKFMRDVGFLVGWKSIAHYIGVCRKTLYLRWREWKIPMFFLESGKNQIPCTHVAWLETWKRFKLEENWKKFSRILKV